MCTKPQNGQRWLRWTLPSVDQSTWYLLYSDTEMRICDSGTGPSGNGMILDMHPFTGAVCGGRSGTGRKRLLQIKPWRQLFSGYVGHLGKADIVAAYPTRSAAELAPAGANED